MFKDPWTLYWNGQPVGRITDIELDWPWVCGRFASGDWPPDARTAVEWLSHKADSEEALPDPPFAAEVFDGWTVVDADGVAHPSSVPVVDFVDGTIECRPEFGKRGD